MAVRSKALIPRAIAPFGAGSFTLLGTVPEDRTWLVRGLTIVNNSSGGPVGVNLRNGTTGDSVFYRSPLVDPSRAIFLPVYWVFADGEPIYGRQYYSDGLDAAATVCMYGSELLGVA